MQNVQSAATFGDLNIATKFEEIAELQAGNSTAERFISVFKEWSTSVHAAFVEFDPSWNNGTGYLDELARIKFHKENGLAIGQLVFSFDPKTRRRIAVIVGRYGNVVIFDRYTDGDKSIFVCNRDEIYAKFVPHGQYSTDDMYAAFTRPFFSDKYNHFCGGMMEEFEDIRYRIYMRDGLGKQA